MLLAIMDGLLPPIQKRSSTPKRRRRKRGVLYISDEKYKDIVSDLQDNSVVLDSASSSVHIEDVDQYLADKATDDTGFQLLLQSTLLQLPQDTRNMLTTALRLLTYRTTAIFLTGSATPITRLSIRQRGEILHRWRTSYIPQLRGLFGQLTTLAKVVFTASNASFLRVSGFPTTPAGWNPPPTYPYEFVRFSSPASFLSSSSSSSSSSLDPAEIETDVVIVGSGCGAGVCAKNLAEAGHRVLVLEKGYHFTSQDFPMAAPDHLVHMIEGSGAVSSDDNSMLVVAGSCFGGGGTVNWSASLQTQGFVRREWAEDRGLGFFDTAAFQACLDRVCAQMGVHEDFEPNHGNQVLLEGARKLGWAARRVPQNTGHCEHPEGHCALGCWSGAKKGPVNGWFPDAAEAGAKFAEGFKVARVLFEDGKKKGTKKAVGVVGTWTSRGKDGRLDGPEKDKIVREVVVRAKRVIISSGSLWSPVILKNSGLKNPQIGRNLYLHPVNVVTAFFKEDVRPWEGEILTAVVNTFENQDNKGHGVKLECTSMMPTYAIRFLNWDNGVDFKVRAMKYRHMNSYISINRDRDPGYIYPDPHSGQPRVHYTPSAYDRKHVMTGNVALAKILYLQGALEIHVSLPGMRPYIRNQETTTTDPAAAATNTPSSLNPDILASVQDAGVADPRFQAWLKELAAHGNTTPETPFTSAHQMGTCRMSSTEKGGVVDPQGKVWGAEGLYVADASVFPSASGVNPMVTNMAISDWISRGVARDLDAETVRARL
ncbi:long-chain fatty alcohol dehydrogenase [Cryphonectria parasitica EP155]|uniref:Long-chain-alcohol oxidase n=1 Tax=Cryphonectria parasitica (strain ATCC 38755 / EP155) TaxID=660469 RepID=A0A9P4Y0Z4_CRYP1|nr:long-chain fatty alcohol dehydrogenase [Cryphonectria parasitica EP155]KAF3764145.1 long-chain fatty alcohol dehydrogenase [Cryphonectria parasitica EP155]